MPVFQFFFLLTSTRASGGLILIAHQASKCLGLAFFIVFFLFPLQLILIRRKCVSLHGSNHEGTCLSGSSHSPGVCECLVILILTPCVVLSRQDVWLCGEADWQHHRERVPPVRRDGPRAAGCGHCQLHQQSHAWTSAAPMKISNFAVVLVAALCWAGVSDDGPVLYSSRANCTLAMFPRDNVFLQPVNEPPQK